MKRVTEVRTSCVTRFMFHAVRNGFSLVELLVVLGMMSIILSIGGLSLANIRTDSQLDLVSSEVRSDLLRARARTSNGVLSGVYFEEDRFVYYEDSVYAEGAAGNLETELPAGLTISSVTLTDSTATFDPLTGYLDSYSDPSEIVITDTVSGISKTVSINEWGTISIL